MKNHVRKTRDEQGISQQEIAARTGVSRQSIHAIETGKYVPTTVLALKLAHALGKTVEALFELEAED